MNITKDGCVTREGNTHVVRVLGSASLLKNPGVECENPEAPEAERIYRKVFKRKKVFLPGELEDARREVLNGRDVINIGMTGYSSIGADNERAWGLTSGAYEAACMDLLGHAIQCVTSEFPGVRVNIVDGASDLGVDRAVITVADKLNLNHLGHSCPRFMFYVKDDDAPVHVAENQAAYADAFVQSLNILLSVGGRMQALEHDMLAAIKYNKRLILLNVLRAISTNGGPSARDGEGKIVDATAAFEGSVFMQSHYGRYSSDPYEDLRTHTAQTVTQVCRKVLEPSRAYGRWERQK